MLRSRYAARDIMDWSHVHVAPTIRTPLLICHPDVRPPARNPAPAHVCDHFASGRPDREALAVRRREQERGISVTSSSMQFREAPST